MEFVSIIMGSKSDYEVMSECAKTLEKFGVSYELIISSAHRSPERTKDYIKDAQSRGAQVFIAAAGMAAHLAGAVAAQTCKPVIGVPLTSAQSAVNGLDSLLATVQMPSGMPVATMAIGKAGAINAAHLAMQILSLQDSRLAKKLSDERANKLKDLEQSSQEIQVLLRG
ncbi:5-(carboxyamino)imidazole ribonucleotide mutase [Helicobacter sp. 23-1046]